MFPHACPDITSSHIRFLSDYNTQCILQVVVCRLQMIENLRQKKAEEQGASEAVGDKLVNKAVSVMENMAALVDR